MTKFIPRPSKGILYRICKDCRQEYEGNGYRCKKCKAIIKAKATKEYYKKNKQKILDTNSAYIKAHPEKNRAKANAYNARKRLHFHVARLANRSPETAAAFAALRDKNLH
jgi:tRNA(Ile2) C34 agmatinyltransferase TiaS